MEWGKQCFRAVTAQSRLKKIMASPSKETDLRLFAEQLGCSLAATVNPNTGKHDGQEIIRRIQEAARSYRESCLWLVALTASVASVFSAIAAWSAILIGMRR
ncbi:MAG TPA: hypothetical protein VEF34_16185 [Syntrophobacteraceae bacterium]|nr:hypothetical protein [Syntrophobacteraceae bacterium]